MTCTDRKTWEGGPPYTDVLMHTARGGYDKNAGSAPSTVQGLGFENLGDAARRHDPQASNGGDRQRLWCSCSCSFLAAWDLELDSEKSLSLALAEVRGSEMVAAAETPLLQ